MKQVFWKRLFLLVVFSCQITALKAQENPFSSNELADSAEVEFLPRDEAFVFSADLLDDTILVRWKIAENYYLYKHQFSFKAENADLGEPFIPEGEMHYDEFLLKELEIFHNFIEIQIPVSNITGPIKFSAKSQGCTEGLCYVPSTKRITFETGTIVAATKSSESLAKQSPNPDPQDNTSFSELGTNQQALADYLTDSSLLISLGLFLLLGLALTFTPCVFPMMPILASIIAGQGKEISTSKAFWLSFTYVQGMAITYVALGVATAGVGHSLAAVFQSLWVVVGASIVFFLLALSMFGFYELKLPSGLQSKLSNVSNSQAGGTFIGVAIMGIISALIVSPCMTAPLAGVLIHIANTGDYLLGGLYMYAMAMGIGVPLIIIGVSEGKLMPKAGSWMDGVKSAFGVALIAVAIIISDHLLPGPVVLILWGILLLVSGVYLGAFDPNHESNWNKFWKAIGLVMVIAAVLQFIGAAQGNKDPLRPLEGNYSQTSQGATSTHGNLPFVQVTSIEEIEQAVKQANTSGKTVMLDLYADWCTACEELAQFTFDTDGVRKALSNTVWLQVDVGDDNNPQTQRIMEKFKVLGLPSVMFFNQKGEEQTRLRVVGFIDEAAFVKRVEKAFKE